MAINFDPIFDGMQNGPEKIKGNFDKVNDGFSWGPQQKFLNLNGMTDNFDYYKIRNDGNEVLITLYVTGDGNGSCYLPTSISKRIGYSLSTQIVGRTDNNGIGFMNINTDTGKCTFHKPDGSGMYIQALVPLV
ncbi:hypothetical protein [Ligilactobacillus salivarius]|uniref:Uncharacterized protein n=1 Tax=Ligilactobacillus salivarius TaxID=1624 RepID=A0A9X6S6L8_9LACO|nr:hypothetical protein [Ligilactobacillus salivarius]OTF88299.1 hypothetical protein A8C38_11225 [Ligilactobacillus salivarius]PAY26028.1 hypothetical protein A8C49_11170 [Ligilactobacillus salivarius]PAY27735.1 hypothetical protein A8C44_11225 [Ligilactobacillus salivarius]PAY28474.1 hypothetical protein A8C33_03765 [Ligilactobacillus salivarius]PAY37051.1 hypothetical protein A8C50_03925 [Ligilactobacillus salivarius]